MLSSVATSFLRSGATRSVVNRTATRGAPLARFFSDGSHDDFAPKRAVVEGEDEAIKMIKVCTVCMFSYSTKKRKTVTVGSRKSINQLAHSLVCFAIILFIIDRNMSRVIQSCCT
jgi:hypothetical protein